MSDDALPKGRLRRARMMGGLGAGVAADLLRAGGRRVLKGDPDAFQDAHRKSATRILGTLGRMRGAAAKFGQLLTQVPSGLPEEYVEQLLDLSNRVPPMHYSLIKTRLIQELGASPNRVFAEFERTPFAAASLGQVHRARLPDGTAVAVKVQYPDIDQTLRADLDNLRLLVKPLGWASRIANFDEFMDEVEAQVTEELDYLQEAANLETYGGLLADEPDYIVPRVHPEYSTQRILTMDYLDGQDIARFLAEDPPPERMAHFGRLLFRFTWLQELSYGVLHVDPNPGNYLFRADGRLGIIDFGCVKRFPEGFTSAFRALIRAAVDEDQAGLDAALVACGVVTVDASDEVRALNRQMADIWARPFRERPFDFSDRSYLTEMIDLRTHLQGERGMSVSRDWLFLGRNMLGLAYLAFRLELREDFGGLIEELLSVPD